MKKLVIKASHEGIEYNVDTLGLNRNGIVPGMSFAHAKSNPGLINEDACISFDKNTEFKIYIEQKDKRIY